MFITFKRVFLTFFSSYGVFLSVCFIVSGCTAVNWLGESTSLKYIGSKSRSYKEFSQDKDIQGMIEKKFYQYQENFLQFINVAVYKKVVLLTGVVSEDEVKENALRLAQDVPGVAVVHEGIHVLPQGSSQILMDQKNKNALQIWLLGDMRIDSRNYVVRVANGIVYILGEAHSKQELDCVIKHCGELSGIRGIENFSIITPKSHVIKKKDFQ